MITIRIYILASIKLVNTHLLNFNFPEVIKRTTISWLILIVFLLSNYISEACYYTKHTSSVNVVQHAYCDCNGKIEIKLKMCMDLPITMNEYKVLINSIVFNDPPSGSVADEGENFRNSLNIIDGEYILILDNLCPGTYTITFGLFTSMFNGFPKWDFYIPPTTVQIEGGGPFSVNINVDNQPCNESSSANFTIVGGEPPFTIQRCDGSHYYKGNERTHTAEMLGEGYYCYKVKNYWGCEQTVNFNVESQNQLILFDFNYSQIQCGEEDGTGYANITNITGTDNYAIMWFDDDDGEIGNEISALSNETNHNQFSTGCYWVVVKDKVTLCTRKQRFCINWIPMPDIIANVTDAGCDDNIKGSIAMEPHESGNYYKWFKKDALGEFEYLSEVNSGTNALYNLEPGEYKICTWKHIKCQACTTVVVKQVEKLEAYIYSTFGEGCYEDDEDGEAILEIYGGCKPYKITECGTGKEYDYATIEDEVDYQIIKIERLKAGTYCFNIQDNGCCPEIQLYDVIIDEMIDKLRFGLTTINVKDGANCSSIAKIAEINGHPPYLVEWLDENGNIISSQNWDGNPPPPEQIVNNFPAFHRARITDALGCQLVHTAIIPDCSTQVVIGIVEVYANPSYGNTSIDLAVIDGPKPVKIKFFNTHFNEVKMTDHGILQEGIHTVVENISQLPAGMYYVGAYFDDLPVGQFHLIQILL